MQAGISPSDIDTLFFSHLHSDHMMDYARLVHARWDEQGPLLPVFGPAPIKEIDDRFFGPEGAFAFDLTARTKLKPSQDVWVARGGSLPRPWPEPQITEIAPGYRHGGDGWTLTSCEAPHAQPWLTCMAFRIEADGKSFVYSGDSGICDGVEALSQGADILLHWCYRLDGEAAAPDMARLAPTPSEIAAMAARAGVKRLILTHFRVHMDAPGKHDHALEAARGAFDGPISIAEDLDIVDI